MMRYLPAGVLPCLIALFFAPNVWAQPVVELTFENSVNRLTQTGSSAAAFTNQNSVAFATGLAGGTGAVFAGNNYLNSNSTPVTTAFSVTFWMKTSSSQANGGSQWYFGAGLVDHELGGVQNDWGVTQLGNKVAFGIGNPDRTLLSTSSVNTGQWVFVAATWSAATRIARVYVNGVLEATDTLSSSATRNTSGLLVGADSNLQPFSYFVGAIDEVRLFGTVLTGTEITGMYNAPFVPTATLVVASSTLKAGQTSGVTITFSQAVSGFTNADLTIANGTLSPVTSSDGGVTWTATLTPSANTTAATNALTLDNTGVQSVSPAVAGIGTTTSNNYAIDTLVPTLTSVAITSTNSNAAWAKVGDTVTVTFTASELIATPTATIAGRAATVSAISGNSWRAVTTMTSGDLAGNVTFSISFSDPAGNPGTAVTTTTNASSIQFSKTGPTFSSASSSAGTFGATFAFTVAASGNSPTFAATGLPAGLTLNATTGAITGTPTQAGAFTVSLTSTDLAGNLSTSSLSLMIAKASQAITFATSGGPDTFTITPTTTSGLTITATVLSGPAIVNGSTFTVTGRGESVVRASQSGNANYFATSADFSFTGQPQLAQSISFAALPDHKVGDASFSLDASASSNLPVTYRVTGPAMLQGGSTVVLTGLPGIVTVIASQGGDGTYLGAAWVIQRFTVVENRPRMFVGDIVTSNNATKVGDVGAILPPLGTSGRMVVVVPSRGIDVAFDLILQPDGTFAKTLATSAVAALAASGGPLSPLADTLPASLTVRGRLAGDLLSGRFDELDLAFSTNVQASGATSNAAGFYTSALLNTDTGSVTVVLGNNGEVVVVLTTPGLATGGRTQLRDDGSFELSVPTGSGVVTVRGVIDPRTATVTGTLIQPGRPSLAFAGLSNATSRNDRLINFSSRAKVGPGSLITGFVVGGGASKRVLLRAIGPSLASFGVPGALQNPRLQLYDGTGLLLLSNDDWQGADIVSTAAQTGAFPLPVGSKDSALIASLAPGAYTMHISAGSEPGVALAEIYDASASPQNEYQRLINISTRGEAGTGENVLTGGFVVTGNAPKRVLIRGIGPGLSALGLSSFAPNPRLRVYQGGTVIAENDDWSTLPADAATNAEGARQAGAFALTTGSKDASLVLTLAPGAYSAQVSAADTTTGTALVEVYEIP